MPPAGYCLQERDMCLPVHTRSSVPVTTCEVVILIRACIPRRDTFRGCIYHGAQRLQKSPFIHYVATVHDKVGWDCSRAK